MAKHTYQQRLLEEATLKGGIEEQPTDVDGHIIPPAYRLVPRESWEKMPVAKRKALSDEFRADWARQAKTLDRRAANAGKAAPTAFTTKYALNWAKAQGWFILASESSHLEFRGKDRKVVAVRRDTLIGSDLVAQSPEGLVLVQAGGKGERSPHWERFISRGGKAECAKLNARFFYVEFVRDDKTPRVVEQWA